MGLKEEFAKQKKELVKRHREDIERGDDQFQSIFIRDKIPTGRTIWSCKEGNHLVDILPFKVGGQHPQARKGDWHYTIQFFAHQRVGALEGSYICPLHTWGVGNACPICEHIATNSGKMTDEEIYAMKAKKRVAYLMWIHDPGQEQKGIQLWEVAHYFMEKNLKAISDNSKGGVIAFYDIGSEGKSVAWTRQGSGAQNTSYLGHRFIDREDPLPDEIIMQSFSLDEALKMKPTYKEIWEAFYNKKYKGKAEESVENPDEEEEQSPSEEESPFSDEGGSEDQSEEEEKEADSDNPCPSKFKFGTDIDQHEECGDCSVWDDCDDEANRLRKVARQKPKQTTNRPTLRKPLKR